MIKDILKILDKAIAKDIKIYNTTTYTPYYDYVIICSVSSNRQGNACATYLKKEAPQYGYEVRNFNAGSDTNWFLVDLNDVIVHIFVGEERARYNLDGLFSHLLEEEHNN